MAPMMIENPFEFWPAELGAELMKDCFSNAGQVSVDERPAEMEEEAIALASSRVVAQFATPPHVRT